MGAMLACARNHNMNCIDELQIRTISTYVSICGVWKLHFKIIVVQTTAIEYFYIGILKNRSTS